MKKAVILILFILLIPEITNCQWYQKYFGLNDPILLTREQVDMALTKSKEGITAGTTLTIIGSVGIVTGAVLFFKDYPDDKYPEQAEMGKKFTGALLALISLPPEIIGISLLKKNILRKSEIESFIEKMEMQVGLCIAAEEHQFKSPVIYYLPAVSLNIRF